MQNTKRITRIISAAGLTVLAAAFIHWASGWTGEPVYILTGALSAALFAAVCLRYVPCWVEFWWGEGQKSLSHRGSGKNSALIFISCLAICFLVLLVAWMVRLMSGWHGSFKESIGYWINLDSRHYIDIARDWYLSDGPWDRLVQLAFFPGYPLTIGLMNLLVGDYMYSALIVAALCFAVSGVLLYKLMLLDMPEERALAAVRYLCIIPGAFFFAAPMSESLFLSLSLGCVYLIRKNRWLLGCAVGALAGFTRSLGIVLLVPAVFELLHLKLKGRALLKRAACLLIIPLGLMAYFYINYAVSGDPFKFMQYQREHWGQGMGWFFNTAAYQHEAAVSFFAAGNGKVALGLWCANLFCSFASLAVMLFGVKNIRPSYGAYFLCYYIAAIGATWLLSAPRYLAAQFALPAALAASVKNRTAEMGLSLVCIILSTLYLCAFVLGCQVW